MRSLDHNIDEAEERLQVYGKEVASLLNKKEYSNFLNYYIRLLYDNLIIYQGLIRVKRDDETFNAKLEIAQKSEEDEKE